MDTAGAFIRIARITRPQGLNGAVRIEPLLDEDRVFETGTPVRLAGASADTQSEIEYFRRQHGRAILKLRGIDSIDQAERIVGAEVQIAPETLPVLEEGAFYTFHLKGCAVFERGEHLGEVTDVLDPGGTEILRVEKEGKEILIPFAQSFLKSIDLDQRRIEVELPEGLRDLNT